jgi:hypothetical protein
MSRKKVPGTIQAAVSDTYEVFGPLKRIQALLGLPLSSLSYGTEVREDRPGGLGVNYLDRLGQIMPEAAEPIAKYFAALAGGIYQPVDLNGVMSADIHRLTMAFSEVLQRHAAAHSAMSKDPNDYTREEARAQVKEVDDLLAVGASLRAALLSKAEDPS